MPHIPSLLPEPTHLPGLCFRHISGEHDAEALYAVHTGRVARDGVDLALHQEDMPTLEGLRSELAQAVTNGEQSLWLVAEVEAQVIGYAQLNGWHEEDGTWAYFIGGWVLPEWRGRGLGTCLLHWGENMARALAAIDHPGERFEFAANASSTEHEAAALLQHEGYTIAFTTLEMQFDPATRLPDPPPLPPGLDWDLWHGALPMRPFSTKLHPQTWRGWFEFGNGAFGDWCPHILDTAHRFLELGLPRTIEAVTLQRCHRAWSRSSSRRSRLVGRPCSMLRAGSTPARRCSAARSRSATLSGVSAYSAWATGAGPRTWLRP